MKAYIKLSILFLSFLLFSCAVQRQPEGGPKDTNPPKIIKQIPENRETNYKGDEIVIYLDEKIAEIPLNNIVIYPHLLAKPKINTKGNKIIITTTDLLEDNKTYNFIFNNAIKDITEGNTLSSYNYVFSTGEQLDSCTLKGIITDAYTNENLKDATVILSRYEYDSFRSENMNKYFLGICKSDDKGYFQMNNLANDECFVYALEDKNSNLIIDDNEKVAFLSNKLNTCIDTQINLKVFPNNPKEKLILNTIVEESKKIKVISEKVAPEEKKILLQLANFSEIVKLSAEELDPSKIAKYLFDLAQSFNSFYENCSVLKAENDEVKNLRLRLIKKVGQTMESGLNLLGIKTVEEM